MLHKILAATVAISLMAGASFAAPAKPAKKATKPAPKVVEVKTCPVTEGKVQGKGSGSRTVGNYKVYFCCPGCDTEWDKWSTAKKLQTAKKLAAKEAKEAKAKKKA